MGLEKPEVFVIFVLIIEFVDLCVRFDLVILQSVVDRIVLMNAKIHRKKNNQQIEVLFHLPFCH